MTIEEVLQIWRPARLAEVLDTTSQNISGWISDGRIPRCRQYEIQVKTGGQLIADSFDPELDYIAIANRSAHRNTHGVAVNEGSRV
ncbi:MAG: hypothetical protein WD005_04275 [Haliea sp.]